MKTCTCLLVMLTAISLVSAAAPRSPITNNAEWKNGQPVALPGVKRPKVESVFLYQPQTNWTYSHHPSITFFKGRYFAIWSNSRRDEDAPGQRVLIATSKDFVRWTTPSPLVDSVTDANGVERVLTAAGFHQHEGTLVAYFGNYGPNKETTRLQAVTTIDGETWSVVREIGLPVNPNHGPQRTATGRLIIAGNISFPYTDDPTGLSGWRMTGIYPPEMAATIKDDPASFWDVARRQGWSAALCEGSFYQTDDGVLHMPLRNTARQRAQRLWLTESRDNGVTWSTPTETEFSDTNAKFHFGRLPDGPFFYVGNPIGNGRTPLVLTLSREGITFGQHFVLGETPYPRCRDGAAKGGEYGYPHTLIHDGYLHVIVSRQKEAVEVLRVALNELDETAAPSDVAFTAQTDGSAQRYVELLPLGYATNQPSPLMIFLHGHGSDRWQITKGNQWKEIQAVCDVAARHQMILISPDYRAATSWMGPAAEADLVQIIQEQKAKRRISQVLLCGGSMGGTSVLIFTALHPELVDGVVSMNGTANMIEFAGFQDAVAASYGGTKTERPDEYRKRSPELMARSFGHIPVAFTAGGKDAVVPPQSVLRLSRELTRHNPDRVLMLYREEVEHSTTYADAVAALEFVIERTVASSRRAELIRSLKPLSVRGVNYYPRETPWGGMWTKTPREVWERDMGLAASLGINTVRTFLSFSSAMEQAGLLQSDGTPTQAYREKIEAFLAAAWKCGIRAILCFEFSQNWLAEPDAKARCRQALSAVITAHREDGRVLLWDLMNEPEDDAKWTEPTRAYLRTALPLVKELDPDHLTTVGLTWRIDRLVKVGLPDVLQYHEYSPKARLFQEGTARVRQDIASQHQLGGQRPLLIGEFGMNTARDPRHGVEASLHTKLQEHPGTEAEQARLYAIVLGAVETERIAGVLSWCLHDCSIPNPNESHFGLVRGDGSLKPATLVLRDTFARWSNAGWATNSPVAQPQPDLPKSR